MGNKLRKEAFRKTYEEIKKKDTSNSPIIWTGDLNFRKFGITNNNGMCLTCEDQLTNFLKTDGEKYNFEEKKVEFCETCKIEPENRVKTTGPACVPSIYGSSKKKPRTPSHCDRIIYYNPQKVLTQDTYDSFEIECSDHNAVYGTFNWTPSI
jgi:hypothetical protein